MIKRFFILSSLCMVLGVSAQKSHTVVQGDNPYNIAKKYGMTVDELLKLNPKHKDGKLAIGDVLAVKTEKAVTSVAPKTAVPEKVGTIAGTSVGKIILQPKQTIYGITKQYRISETDLRKLNPELDSNMKIGDEITLPLASIKKYGGDQPTVTATKPVEAPAEKTVTATPTTPAVEGESYVIQAKDNYYRITKQFGISQQDLYTLNPGLEEKGLKPGETIKIKRSNTEPVAETTNPKTKMDSGNEKSSTASSNVVVGDDYVTYTVQQGDTVFSIVNKFGVSIDELIALNPDLSKGLKSGMVLKIKKQDPVYVKKSGDALSVVLMLPFGYSTNETQYRGMALDFLTGAKLAIERNARGGQKLDIKIVDSGNEASFKNSLTQINPENTDLIIGPFFKSNVIDVLDFTKNQKIPVVAPFANTPELYNYNNLIIVETNNQTYADKIVEEVKAVYSDQKIYVVADGKKENANYIKSGLEKAVKNPNIVIVNSSADIQLDQNMMTGQSAPVIAVLANDDMGEAFANKMIALSKEVQGVKAFSMFYSPVFEKKVDDLSQASLVYLMDRKINTDGNFEKEILAAYKSKYCKTPPKYAIVGFDVVNDMLTRENKKGEIFKQMNKVQTQLATKFEFVKSKANGAYVNTGYRVIRLVP
ncbi:LysM peptidoglycan-binding domain-containing protein [Chryseobacterium sp. BIGb0232]|uniref:LysM peptidoglycan-binding domain-containing protein n=1 Tax=Chryseobacterium sp. BIGb0232 TaxID=2940598 RepID=UPI000F92B7C2|nr:LysM peptidoglycan-binding domain-containing protein [Chryseobacterium sp. BIGb0232]MCS4303081.1 LysM repeat protein [Chryseobacterium sp. BIGb0232]ROS14632.1 ABC-type branched-subunit amino acid transport system substrate-binding protein [Chryseobacterium nakagawai]